MKQGNDSQAVIYLEKAVALNSNEAGWFASLATLYKKLGGLEKAAGAFRLAIALNDNVPVWHAELFEVEDLLGSGQRAADNSPNSVKKAAWYNEFYSKSQQYLEPYFESVYFPIWKIILEKLMFYNRTLFLTSVVALGRWLVLYGTCSQR